MIAFNSRLEIAILPDLPITSSGSVKIANKKTGYEIYLAGNINYALLQYDDIKDYKERLLSSGDLATVFRIARGHLLLTVAPTCPSLASLFPEAVNQALAFAKISKISKARLSVSDGESWIFFSLESVDDNWVYYDSTPRSISRRLLRRDKLRELVHLVSQWYSSWTLHTTCIR